VTAPETTGEASRRPNNPVTRRSPASFPVEFDVETVFTEKTFLPGDRKWRTVIDGNIPDGDIGFLGLQILWFNRSGFFSQSFGAAFSEIAQEALPSCRRSHCLDKGSSTQLCLSVSLIFNSTGDYSVVSYDVLSFEPQINAVTCISG